MGTIPLSKKDPERYYAILDRFAEGASIAQVCREFHIDFYTVKKYFPNVGRPDLSGGQTVKELDPEKYREIGRLVAEGASLNEIMRSCNTDHRTIKRLFPNAGWTRGGKGAKLMKHANDVLGKETK